MFTSSSSRQSQENNILSNHGRRALDAPIILFPKRRLQGKGGAMQATMIRDLLSPPNWLGLLRCEP